MRDKYTVTITEPDGSVSTHECEGLILAMVSDDNERTTQIGTTTVGWWDEWSVIHALKQVVTHVCDKMDLPDVRAALVAELVEDGWPPDP